MDSTTWEYIKYLIVTPIIAVIGFFARDKIKQISEENVQREQEMKILQQEVQSLQMKVITLETQYFYINKNLEELKDMLNTLLNRKQK